jgi:hypothetical protein
MKKYALHESEERIGYVRDGGASFSWWPVMLIITLLSAVIGGYLYYQSQKKKENAKQ